MVGAPKASGGFGITSLPRSTGTETTKAPTAPTTQAPETGKAKQGGGRENNPVLQSLMADGFEGNGAQGKGLALGHLKNAEKKAAKKAGKGGEAGEAPPAGQPAGTPQEGLQKLLADLTKLIEQFQTQKPGTPTPENTGIVPPAPTAPAPAPAEGTKPYPI